MKLNDFPNTSSFSTKTYAKQIAERLGESNFRPFMLIADFVPRPIIELALKETERAVSSDVLHRSLLIAFMDRLRFYARAFGFKLPKCLRD